MLRTRADQIGLPAKSGVSGIVISVVPNVIGLAAFSPRLDSFGNSVRSAWLALGELSFQAVISCCLLPSAGVPRLSNIATGVQQKHLHRLCQLRSIAVPRISLSNIFTVVLPQPLIVYSGC